VQFHYQDCGNTELTLNLLRGVVKHYAYESLDASGFSSFIDKEKKNERRRCGPEFLNRSFWLCA